ncbi:MAG: FCD domain-containing protein [Boseongicola sp. SB0676_bin_33]|uniref:FCD domain-containing protein n=1 Tax=Boseongicola sp. SB0664_bin_43 TaxID=2604844 RepID=A0A6B0Y6B4_9RHOB|nr:FCD domain-containing protein [Boseongicola sp. SB0664_bin_43]MYF88678.1 FCD domain-containing protein [Boseongicola sp. SB0676_bin_33]MYK31610.1 FCD domain-containing protein [Boseongicola sp. SB0670_bin_30]
MTEERNPDARARAADNLVSIFELQIIDGTLAVGKPLPPEREIMQSFGVSRTVVREAVQTLAVKGLVNARPRFRPVVRTPGYDAAIEAVGSVVNRLLTVPGGVRNLFELRIMMEAALVRDAALHADKNHVARIKQALDDNEAALGDSERFFETDVAFHRVLYEVPANPVLPPIHQAYTDWLSSHWTRMPQDPERNHVNFKAHGKIFQMILFRDPDAAERALRDHLDEAWNQVRLTFAEA